MPTNRRHAPSLAICAVAALALIAGACSGDTGPNDADAESPAPADGTAADTLAPGATPGVVDPGSGDLRESAVVSVDESAAAGEVRALVRTVDVGETVRYAGFSITVNAVDFGFDPGGFRVAVVRVTLTNHTARADSLQTAVEIESQGTVATIDRDVTPEVPSGSSADGTLSLRLDEGFTFDDAILFIGRADRQRAQIPLGTAGELVTRTPQVLTDLGGDSDGVSTITLDRVTVAWDRTDPREQAGTGQVLLHVDYALESAVRTSVGPTIMLVVPDGAIIEPDTATIATIEAGAAPTALTASFSVPDPPDGDYVLRYVERFGQGAVEVGFTLR